MKRGHWLILALLCGLALWFTRYQGLAVVVGAGLFLKSWRDRAVVILPAFVLAVLGYIFVPAMRPLLVPTGNMASNIANVPIGLVIIAPGALAFALTVYLVKLGRELVLTRILAGAVVVYAVSLLVLVICNRFDPLLDTRLFAPVTAPMVVLLVGLTMRYLPALGPVVLAGLALEFVIFIKGVL